MSKKFGELKLDKPQSVFRFLKDKSKINLVRAKKKSTTTTKTDPRWGLSVKLTDDFALGIFEPEEQWNKMVKPWKKLLLNQKFYV